MSDTTSVPDAQIPGDEDETVGFDETADVDLEQDTLEPDEDSPVKDEQTADRFTDPGL
jgi:hypothetical protein